MASKFSFTVEEVNDMLTEDVLAIVAQEIQPSKDTHETLNYLYQTVKIMVREHDKNLAENSPLRIVGKRGRKASNDVKPTSIADILARK